MGLIPEIDAANQQKAEKKARRSRFLRWIIAILVFVAILAVIIPPAVVFTLRKRRHQQQHRVGPAATVIFPLYIYPLPGAWDPLYKSLEAYPRLNFTIIVNPNSGPGEEAYPGDEYAEAVEKLSTYPNVQMIGYVHLSWGARNISDVFNDISLYAGWTSFNRTGLAVSGIFFDETPADYSQSNLTYLETVNQAAKDAVGLQLPRTVVQNPGTIVDNRLNIPSTDTTIVFEDTYAALQDLESDVFSLAGFRRQYGYIINAVPETENLYDYINTLSQHARYLFVTTLVENFYESFGPEWDDFIQAMSIG